MIDFHSHIMFGVDDGARDIDMSLAMILNSQSQGVKYIVSTPHFIYGQCETSLEEYNEKLEAMRTIGDLDIKILKGLEVYIDPNLPKFYDEGIIWGINDSRYMLIELPMREFPKYTEDVFYELRLKGIIPILAHPERNLAILKNPKLLENLLNQGNLAQVNAGSLQGIYGKTIKTFAETLVKRNMIHLIGSDGHNNTKRSTELKEGYKIVRTLNKELHYWIKHNEENIIENNEVEVLPISEEKKSFFKKLFG